MTALVHLFNEVGLASRVAVGRCGVMVFGPLAPNAFAETEQ